jgi:hypothetical protein
VREQITIIAAVVYGLSDGQLTKEGAGSRGAGNAGLDSFISIKHEDAGSRRAYGSGDGQRGGGDEGSELELHLGRVD